MSPLLEAMIGVDTNAGLLMRHVGTRRQKEEMRDALQDLRRKVLDTVAARAAEGAELDVESFKAIVRLASERGRWSDFSLAFNQVAREVGR